MKKSFNNTEEKNFNVFGFDTLSENEMMQVRGGETPPKTRDKDVWGDEGETQG